MMSLINIVQHEKLRLLHYLYFDNLWNVKKLRWKIGKFSALFPKKKVSVSIACHNHALPIEHQSDELIRESLQLQ